MNVVYPRTKFTFATTLSRFFILFVLFLSVTKVNGQGGQMDPSFNNLDRGTSINEGADKDIRSIALQSDGKIIIGGLFNSFNSSTAYRIARINGTGLIDPSFNTGTGADSTVFKIAVQADQKIIIGGAFTLYNGNTVNYITRLLPNGSIDNSFITGTGFDGFVKSITIQTDGKIIVGGNFNSYNGSTAVHLIRLNTDGSPDINFIPAGILSSVNDIAVQADEKILIGLNNDQATPVSNYLLRLNADGSSDTNFNSGGSGANNSVNCIRIQPDGNILFGGKFSLYNNLNTNLTRILPSGAIDASFDNTAGGFPAEIHSIALQTEGKIVVGWGEHRTVFADGTEGQKVNRLNADGTSDTGFRFDFLEGLNENVFAVLVQPDGKILVAETYSSKFHPQDRYGTYFGRILYAGARDFKLNRYNNDGSRDMEFCIKSLQTGANKQINMIVYQPDGKALIGGFFYTYNGESSNYITRINTNGLEDQTFNSNGIGPNTVVYAIALQADGKILIGGMFDSYNGEPANYLIRLNADGTRDATFNYTEPTTANVIKSITIQPDGKILVGGFSSLIRLNADGSKDTGFTTTFGNVFGYFFPFVNTTVLQPDGKIIIGGSFPVVEGENRKSIARLNTDGSLDTGFGNPQSGPNNGEINSILLLPNGKMILAGYFSNYSTDANTTKLINNIVQLTASGEIDADFNTDGIGISANSQINCMALNPDGSFMVGGNFSSYNGAPVKNIMRLRSNGTMDYDFNVSGSGVNGILTAINQQPNANKFLVAGSFNKYNDFGKNNITRIHTTAIPTISNNVSVCASQLPYNWLGNSYNQPGSYQNGIVYPDGSEVIANINLIVGAGLITGPDRVCQYIADMETPVYQVTAPQGSQIIWSVSKPATMQIISGQNTTNATIRYTAAFTTGTIYARVINVNCGINVVRSFPVTTNTPSTPGPISNAITSICSMIGKPNVSVYSIRKVSTASAYIWTTGPGTTVYHQNEPGVNDTMIFVKFENSYSSSDISVSSVNDCGISNSRTIAVNRIAPSTPGTLSGPTNVCSYILNAPIVDIAVYSVPAVPGIYYEWSVPPGSEVYSAEGSNILEIRFPGNFSTGTIAVYAVNGCGSSNPRILNIRALATGIPGAVTETLLTDCPNKTYSYSVASLPANADSLIWAVPAGATLVSGQGTTSIVVAYPTTAVSGFITVQSVNHCSISAVRKFTVNQGECSAPLFTKAVVATASVSNIPENQFEVKLFPNPSVSDFKLQVTTRATEPLQVRVLDVQGRFIRQIKMIPGQTLALGNDFKAGVYFIEVTQGKSVKTVKAVKL